MSTDAALGKFLEGEGGVAVAALSGVYNPVQLGLYTYTNHNPLKLKDPNGRESVGEWLEQQGAAAAAAGDDARLNQLGVVYALWTAFGSEGLSQIADEYASGERAPDGSGVSAAIEIATGPIQFGKLLAAAFRVGGLGALKIAKSGLAWAAAKLGAREAAAPVARLARDIAVSPVAPRALPLNRPISKSATQNARLQSDIASLRAQGATDFRVNQQQVNAAGQRVGVNRPDLQYTLNGKRNYVEYDTAVSNRGAGHRTRIEANDPNGTVTLIVQD